MKSTLKASARRNLATLEMIPRQIPSWMHGLEPGELLRLLRQHFHMTQAQLARRSGVPQAKIARIESMKTDFRWSTLRRLLEALEAEPLLLPQARSPWKAWLRARAHAAAERRVGRVLGTSALESQQPTDKDRRAIVKDEEERLLQSGGSELWEDV